MKERQSQSVCGLLSVGIILSLCALTTQVLAEEGGSGHYFPGSISSFIDSVPAEDMIIFRLNVVDYDAEFDSDVAVPIAGVAALDVEVETTVVALTSVWRPPVELGEHWSYALGLTVPFVDLTVDADVGSPRDPLSRTVRRSESVSGLGDVMLFPLMLNYNVNKSLNYNFRINAYAPTGDFKEGALANEGKNYWSVEPVLGMVYLGAENGRELSAYLGATFNEENGTTDYETGNQMHAELTAAQHFPLWGGLAGLGLTGYWYEQVTGDSGDGATFGSFKAEARGVGPTVSFVKQFGDAELMTEFKWVHEFDVERRPEGDILFLKALLKFQ